MREKKTHRFQKRIQEGFFFLKHRIKKKTQRFPFPFIV